MLNLPEIFEQFNDDFLKFDDIEKPLHSRPDLCAFLMLDALMPGKRDMVSSARHDEIFLDFDCEKLAEIASVETIRDLIRCGIRYSEESLCMFV